MIFVKSINDLSNKSTLQFNVFNYPGFVTFVTNLLQVLNSFTFLSCGNDNVYSKQKDVHYIQ